MNAANETVEPLPLAGPLCDEHRARLIAGEDWEPQGSQQSATGTAEPSILMGESLLALNQYVVLEAPRTIRSGSRHGHLIPLQVRRRGDPNERELTLVIPPDMLPAFANFFQHVSEKLGENQGDS